MPSALRSCSRGRTQATSRCRAGSGTPPPRSRVNRPIAPPRRRQTSRRSAGHRERQLNARRLVVPVLACQAEPGGSRGEGCTEGRRDVAASARAASGMSTGRAGPSRGAPNRQSVGVNESQQRPHAASAAAALAARPAAGDRTPWRPVRPRVPSRPSGSPREASE